MRDDNKEPNWSPAIRALMARAASLSAEIELLEKDRMEVEQQIAAAKVDEAAPVRIGDLVRGINRRSRIGKVYRVAYIRHAWDNLWEIGGYQRLKDGSFSESGKMLGYYDWEPMPAADEKDGAAATMGGAYGESHEDEE